MKRALAGAEVPEPVRSAIEELPEEMIVEIESDLGRRDEQALSVTSTTLAEIITRHASDRYTNFMKRVANVLRQWDGRAPLPADVIPSINPIFDTSPFSADWFYRHAQLGPRAVEYQKHIESIYLLHAHATDTSFFENLEQWLREDSNMVIAHLLCTIQWRTRAEDAIAVALFYAVARSKLGATSDMMTPAELEGHYLHEIVRLVRFWFPNSVASRNWKYFIQMENNKPPAGWQTTADAMRASFDTRQNRTTAALVNVTLKL